MQEPEVVVWCGVVGAICTLRAPLRTLRAQSSPLEEGGAAEIRVPGACVPGPVCRHLPPVGWYVLYHSELSFLVLVIVHFL